MGSVAFRDCLRMQSHAELIKGRRIIVESLSEDNSECRLTLVRDKNEQPD